MDRNSNYYRDSNSTGRELSLVGSGIGTLCNYSTNQKSTIGENNDVQRNSSTKVTDLGSRCYHRSKRILIDFTCNTKICQNCLSFHTGHIVECFREYVPRAIRIKAKELRDKHEFMEKVVNDEEANLFRCIEHIKLEIEKRASQLNFIIESKKVGLLETLRRIEKSRTQSLNNLKQRHLDALREIENWERNMDSVPLHTLSKQYIELAEKYGVEDLNVDKIYFAPGEVEVQLGKIILPPYAKSTTLSVPDQVHVGTINVCTVTIKDEFKQTIINEESNIYTVTVALVDDHFNEISVFLENDMNGCFKISFFPLKTGSHTLSVILNDCHIQESPRLIDVTEKSDENDEPLLSFGGEGNEEGLFCRIWGVCCDSFGRIFVTDRCNHRVQIFNEDGSFYGKFGAEGSNPGEFNRPTGLAINKAGKILVADKDNHRIQIFNSNGIYLNHFGKFASEEESLHYPWDVAVNEQSHIAVSETINHRIRLFDETGIILKKFDFSTGSGLGAPRGLVFLQDGSLLATDFLKHKLVLLNPDFTNALACGRPGVSLYEFNRPQGMARNNSGMLAVCDSKNHRIQVFKNKMPHKIIGKYGRGRGEFDTPQSVAFNPKGQLIVADFGNSRIQLFDV